MLSFYSSPNNRDVEDVHYQIYFINFKIITPMCLILEIMGIPLFSIENSILKDIIMIYFDQHVV